MQVNIKNLTNDVQCDQTVRELRHTLVSNESTREKRASSPTNPMRDPLLFITFSRNCVGFRTSTHPTTV